MMMASTMNSPLGSPCEAALRELRQLSTVGKTGLLFWTIDGKHIAQVGLSEGRIEFLSFRGRYGLDALPLMAQAHDVRCRFQEGLLVSLQNNTKLPPTEELLEKLEAALVGGSRPARAGEGLSSSQRGQLIQHLSEFLGPMAQVVGPEKIAHIHSWDAAVAALAALITDAKQAQKFTTRCLQPPAGSSKSSAESAGGPISSEQQQKLMQLLARFIGPMAELLGPDEIRKAAHFDDAVARLCRVLDDKTAEKQFVEQAKSLR